LSEELGADHDLTLDTSGRDVEQDPAYSTAFYNNNSNFGSEPSGRMTQLYDEHGESCACYLILSCLITDPSG
jgi:hypothetical protein